MIINLNKEAMREVVKHVKEEPLRLHMEFGFSTRNSDKFSHEGITYPAYGMVGCFGGWACQLFKLPVNAGYGGDRGLGYDWSIIEQNTQRFMRIPTTDLFYVSSWPSDLQDRYKNVHFDDSLTEEQKYTEYANLLEEAVEAYILKWDGKNAE